jgi:hypothetical protein
MTKDEALRLALEALCVAVEPKKGKVYAREFEPIDCYAMHEQAITAIKAALEAKDGPERCTPNCEVLLQKVVTQRTWVGLINEERYELLSKADWMHDPESYAVLVEAKLKEKNNG